MIIQTGKKEGWLHLDLDATLSWLEHCGVKFHACVPATIPGRGTGLKAIQDLESSKNGPQELLTIPQDLILSLDAIKQHAQFDRDFREVLDSIDEFGRTPRGAILTFLLFQATLSSPQLAGRFGVHCEFTQYVKCLPCEALPTFWTPTELELLVGTTLAPAVSSKVKRLRKEFDDLCSGAAKTKWMQLVEPYLEFDDWLQVDAMFRSRALDFHGSCMIPGLDLASHASGEATTAFYDRDDTNYKLLVINGKSIKKDEEVTITYGDEKGACEMIFSYGFLEEGIDTAETLYLNLAIPPDDPYRAVKAQQAECAPGFKLIDISDNIVAQGDPTAKTSAGNAVEPDIRNEAGTKGDQTSAQESARKESLPVPTKSASGAMDWKGDFVWLLCVTEEDGLSFELAHTVDGEEEVRTTFQGQELAQPAGDLRRILAQSELWDVYRLRAIVILQQRVFEQLQTLFTTQDQVEHTPHGDAAEVSEHRFELALRLRRLEFELLEKAYEDFEAQKIELANSQVVQRYLAEMNGESAEMSASGGSPLESAEPEEDFA